MGNSTGAGASACSHVEMVSALCPLLGGHRDS